jgi:DNA-binding LacI/PurR family transcriptional regulator
MREAVVDGFMIGSTGDRDLIENASNRRLPFVVMDVSPDPAIHTISIEARAGAYAAAQHLTALGHRRIAIVSVRRTRGGPIVHPPGTGRRIQDGIELDHEKLDGYADALAAAGLSLDDCPIVETLPSDPEAGRAILDAAPDATGLLVMSDRQALTILAEAATRNISVPGRLSIIGFDGVPETAMTTPPLTTVAQPVREKGRLAAQILIEGGPPRQLTLGVELLQRGSTGPAP